MSRRRRLRPTLVLTGDDAAAMLSGLIDVNVQQMRRAGPSAPSVEGMIKAGQLVYEPSDPDEHWKTYDELRQEVAAFGFADADCEDLSAALAAELRLKGDPSARVVVYKVPRSNIAHVVVASRRFGTPGPPGWGLGPGWRYMDPSVAAGMPDPTREQR